jgi:heat shock protein HslJ
MKAFRRAARCPPAQAAGCVPPELADRTFWATSVTEHGIPRALAGGSRVTLQLTADGRLIAHGGCNLIVGHADLSGGRLMLGADTRITEKSCAEDLIAQDRWLAEFLAARPSWQLSGSCLHVSARGTIVELTDRRVLNPDRPLEGTRWVCSALLGGHVRDGSLEAMSEVFLTFGHGRVSGSDGYEAVSGQAAVSDTSIDFGHGPDAAGSVRATAASDLARHVRATLHGVVRYQIEADELTLSGANLDTVSVGLYLTADPGISSRHTSR